jgi:hypothetical protein
MKNRSATYIAARPESKLLNGIMEIQKFASMTSIMENGHDHEKIRRQRQDYLMVGNKKQSEPF